MVLHRQGGAHREAGQRDHGATLCAPGTKPGDHVQDVITEIFAKFQRDGG